MSPTVTPTAKMMMQLLQRHFIKPGEELPGGVFLTEVPAPHASRRADALYIGFTGSRGHHINAFEIKATRADWLTELNDPTKAEAWWKHCHKFWLVCPRGTVKLGELPDGWGLMHPGKSKVRMDIEVQPTIHEPEFTMGLVLEIAKKLDLYRAAATRQVRNDFDGQVREKVNKALDEERKNRVSRGQDRESRASATLDRLSKLTGLRLDGALSGGIYCSEAEAADAIKAFHVEHVERTRTLDRTTQSLRRLRDEINGLLSDSDA